MKTAMQQHLEWLKARMTVTPQMEQELLDREMNQLIDAFIAGDVSKFNQTAEKYYNQTFKQD